MTQVGTMKLETENNGTVSLPVFEPGDGGSNVFEMVRVQTDSGAGFVPAVDTPDASYPYVRVQTGNNGVLAIHNDSLIGGDWDNFDWDDAKWK